jgi:hypothetical protein
MATSPAESIRQRQNSPEALRLMEAARRLHTVAKRLDLASFAGTVVLLLAVPVIRYAAPSVGPVLGAIAGVWVFIARGVLDPASKRMSSKAVLAQDMFDRKVYDLPASSRQLSPEDVRSAADKYDGDSVKDWYAPSDGFDHHHTVLLCQRQTAVWAKRLHQRYAILLAVVGLAAWAGGIAVAVATSASLVEYLVAVLLPSLPALLRATENWQAHRTAAAEREAVELAADDRAANGVTVDDCASLQADLTRLRADSPHIPDRFYARFRERDEALMQEVAADHARKT